MKSAYVQLMLLTALVFCAVMLVHVSHQSRRLFIELELEQDRAKQMEVEWSQLQLEQSALGKFARIEAMAKRDLNMVTVATANTRFMVVGSK